ncbi:hypothetical protein M2480_001460 [Parabacteroides sp. PFB2-12]|uniref:NVEALA domain-containing protein n=1 Tax=unclassified Parabacteroides TaxID=2649774 RepID=UPI002474E6AE|nr:MULTISPECIES: NVEALA domain-containing protein [unclassified Parabacteroides]MDH6342885.1 hypothetical protein [Parabacteroides sp. PM6-13]MDH6390485.1 hypothetical protein [Parabacteroides sp. PFB2-12]
MKKKILSTVMLVAIAATAGWNSYQNENKVILSELGLANVEALARNEGGGGKCGKAAYEYDNDWYEDTKDFMRCGDCEWKSGTSPQYTDC